MLTNEQLAEIEAGLEGVTPAREDRISRRKQGEAGMIPAYRRLAQECHPRQPRGAAHMIRTVDDVRAYLDATDPEAVR